MNEVLQHFLFFFETKVVSPQEPNYNYTEKQCIGGGRTRLVLDGYSFHGWLLPRIRRTSAAEVILRTDGDGAARRRPTNFVVLVELLWLYVYTSYI